MSEEYREKKYDYWTMPLKTMSGVAWIDRRDVSGFVKTDSGTLEVHMKSGTIFTVTEWDDTTIDDLLLKFSPYTLEKHYKEREE